MGIREDRLHPFDRQRMNMKIFLLACSAILFTFSAHGRIMPRFPFQMMYTQANLVVIARPISVKDTSEKTTLPGIISTFPDGTQHRIDAVGVETEFSVEALVKGEKSPGTKFMLHHLKLADPKDIGNNGPMLVTFDPSQPESYLLFLKKEADGRFAPINGQTDPGIHGTTPASWIDLIAVGKMVSAPRQSESVANTNASPTRHLTGYRTGFELQKVVWGNTTTNKVVLHHFEDAPDSLPPVFHFKPEPGDSYLLFLTKEAEGVFTPVRRRDSGSSVSGTTSETSSIVKLDEATK